MQTAKKGFLGSSGRVLVVVGLHVVAIYLIATSLGIIKVPNLESPMQAIMINVPPEAKPIEPKIVKPQIVEPTLDVPQPDMVPIPEVEVPVQAPSNAAISATQTDAVESTELQVSNRIAPAYPATSRRAGDEGTVTFKVLVDERGHALQVSVMQSSGHPALDDAALAAIRKWTFVPPTRSGQAVRSWSRVRVTFRLDA